MQRMSRQATKPTKMKGIITLYQTRQFEQSPYIINSSAKSYD